MTWSEHDDSYKRETPCEWLLLCNMQCRFNHGPNGPVARAPELQAYPGGPGPPTGMFFTVVLDT